MYVAIAHYYAKILFLSIIFVLGHQGKCEALMSRRA
jgi:hypothetical protein